MTMELKGLGFENHVCEGSDKFLKFKVHTN